MERELGVAGRLLGLGVLDNLLPLLWETQPERFPLAGVVLDHAHGADRPLATTSRERARDAGYDGPALAHPASRRGRSADVDAGERRRRATR